MSPHQYAVQTRYPWEVYVVVVAAAVNVYANEQHDDGAL